MRTISVKLEDELMEALERFSEETGFGSKSELIREALRQWLVGQRKKELEVNLQRYLQDEKALRAAADEVEGRMGVTEESLARVEEREE